MHDFADRAKHHFTLTADHSRFGLARGFLVNDLWLEFIRDSEPVHHLVDRGDGRPVTGERDCFCREDTALKRLRVLMSVFGPPGRIPTATYALASSVWVLATTLPDLIRPSITTGVRIVRSNGCPAAIERIITAEAPN